MTEEFKKQLENYGFKIDKSGRGILDAFTKDTYVLEPNILVQGAHATDIACIHFVDEEEVKGFCYYSSLLEELAMRFPFTHNAEGIIKKINKFSDSNIKIKWINCYNFIVSECDETDLKNGTLIYSLSDIMKVIGQLDYLVQKRLNYLDNKERKS